MTQTILIYGASDDLIEVCGSIDEELMTYDEVTTIRFSNGDEFVVTYDGDWHIEPPKSFENMMSKAEVLPPGTIESLPDYSEVCVYRAWGGVHSVEKV